VRSDFHSTVGGSFHARPCHVHSHGASHRRTGQFSTIAVRSDGRRAVYLEGGLQTRKWTDQGGQERYTTGIVLNRFRGELTMLDGAGGARGAGGGMPQVEGGYDEGYGGSFGDEPSSPAATAPARTRTPVNDLDDDIPF
jgi:single-stranded DNA-binding protein